MDCRPKAGAQPGPEAGTPERYKLQEWLHFIATELHKGFGPVNNPKTNDEAKQFFKNRLLSRFEFLARSLEGRKYLVGDDFTVADGYAYYTLRNLRKLDPSVIEKSADLKAYFERLSERSGVRAALQAEGLS
jgi:glutathione S-transferase